MRGIGPRVLAILAGCASASEPLSVVDVGIKSGQTVFLRASTGAMVTVQEDSLHTRWLHHGLWQSLEIEKDGEDSAVSSGDTIYLKTAYGKHITVSNGAVFAQEGKHLAEQVLTIQKKGGSGFIQSGDTVSFLTSTGQHIAAEDLMVRAKLGGEGDSVLFTIEADEPGEFDGRWTEEDDPGREVFIIKRDTMHLVNKIETRVLPLGNHTFSTGLSGKTAHKKGTLVDGEIHWCNGDIWIPVKGKFDGHWTDRASPGKDTFVIQENVLTMGPDKSVIIEPGEGVQFSTLDKRAPSSEAELLAFEIHWSNGDVWVPHQYGEFDGRWTGKQNPEADYFDIEGRMLFFDEGLESKITFIGDHTFSTDLVGQRMHAEARLENDLLHWNNGDVWIRAKVYDPAFWKFTPTVTTTVTTPTTPQTVIAATTASASTLAPGSTTLTTTTTTASSCWEESTTYEPFDMDGSNITLEPDVESCQQRCRRTPRCTHFAYWWLVEPGHCHLQDVFALKQNHRFGFRAGPPRCYKNQDHRKSNMVRLNGTDFGNNTYVPYAYRCLEMGRSYSPSIKISILGESSFPKPRQAVKECMRLCRNTTGCAHFSIAFPHRLCALHNEEAVRLRPIFKHIAGPPSCDGPVGDAVEEDSVIDAFLADLPRSSLRLGRAASAPTVCAVAASAAGLLLLFAFGQASGRVCRRRDSAPSRSYVYRSMSEI